MGGNAGIAAAQNTGIKVGLEERFDYVLLSDQDSLPATDMVSRLMDVALRLQDQGLHVGSVSATYVDPGSESAQKFQVQEPDRLFYSWIEGVQARPWVEIVTAIASGSLLPVGVFTDIGMMREDYFIDFVDTEWCHRARHHGYRLYGTALAQMQHRVGDGHFRVWFWRWKSFNRYSPLRLRYRFRNAVLLLASGYVPWRWKVRSAWTWLGDAYAHVLFSPNHLRNFVAIAQGVMDGIANRGGAIR
jgi:rhamnosyltransferase